MNYIKDNSTKESVPSLANKYKKPSQFSKKEYGDYQTPLLFARKVIEYAISKYDINPELIIEPTCGVGNFIKHHNINFEIGSPTKIKTIYF